jgi:6-phosphogluconolactonase
MQLRIFPNETEAAHAGAAMIAAEARAAISQRGRFFLALSGGSSPLKMFAALANEDVLWGKVHLFQVDERIAPAGHQDRNLTHLEAVLLRHITVPGGNQHPMPVESDDLDAATLDYANQMRELAGSPPVLDLAHLGMGSDGHTASLIPSDPVLEMDDRDVAVTRLYQGRRRMTLTYPVLHRARRIIWLVAGESKRQMLERLLEHDAGIPAGRVRHDNAVVFVDEAAAGALGDRDTAVR